jgi:phenylalanyl-tRNA synthetase beta chain
LGKIKVVTGDKKLRKIIMKISMKWIFDHIDSDFKSSKIKEIVSRFNKVTAEIEDFSKVSIDVSSLYAAKITSVQKEHVTLHIPELKKETELTPHPTSKKDSFFLLHSDGKDFRWATCKDVYLDKEGLLPAFDISPEKANGKWRNLFESQDVILDVDNKSMTHRPDMWGHRGFAREVAAFMKLHFIEKKNLIEGVKVGKSPFTIEIRAEEACKRFSGLYFSSIENKPSNLFIASRLIKVGVRPINGIVDLTNYVMLDWSQPVHAYDAEKISDEVLIARTAKKGELLELLDGQQIELEKEDLIICDNEKVLGLAGVMGGLHDSISDQTNSVFFESAHFDATFVRRSSLRHGVRTESSARFEKTLDPNQITDAICRFVFLLSQVGIKSKIEGDIICVGKDFKEQTIGVEHSFLERRSGVKLKKEDIVDSLTRIGFKVEPSDETIGDKKDILYKITIPSYRGAKDVEIKEDILEEVIRFFGFDNIALKLPCLEKKPGDLTSLFRLRKINEFLVRSARMREQKNYAYYDEDFLSSVGLDFEDCIKIKNPVSENNTRIVSSLLPNLFKNISQNIANETSLKFFESGRVCRIIKNSLEEKKSLAGIFFEKRKKIDFYECKQHVVDLLKVCGIRDSIWKKVENKICEVEIFCENKKLGDAGKIDNSFLCKLGGLPESDAFFFEFDLDLLLAHIKEEIVYTPISKFQEVTFDLSFMIPITLTVDLLESTLYESNDLIKRVEMVDFFDKEEWADKRSVAFRLWVDNPEKTLLKEEIEDVRQDALKSAEKLGGQIRS